MRCSLSVLALVIAAPALAGTADHNRIVLNVEGMPPASALDGDPDMMICTRQHQIGSRLHAGQVCKTRGEWVAQRDDMRNQLANGQLRQVNRNGEGGPTGDVGMFQPCTALHGC